VLEAAEDESARTVGSLAEEEVREDHVVVLLVHGIASELKHTHVTSVLSLLNNTSMSYDTVLYIYVVE
jgi:hypothetical protein